MFKKFTVYQDKNVHAKYFVVVNKSITSSVINSYPFRYPSKDRSAVSLLTVEFMSCDA